MSQRFRDVKSYVLLSLILAAGGAIAVACGSDEDTNTEGQPPGAGPSAGAGNIGASGASAEPGAAGATGSEPVGAAAGSGAGGSEGQPVDLPIDNPPTQGGAGPGEPAEPPPPGTALAPNCSPAEGNVPNLGLELVAGGLADPIYVSGVPGDDSRLVIMQKGGIFRTLVDGELQDAPFLDLSGQLLNQGERGALGLAFHPNYAENGLLYVHYSSNGSDGLPGNGDTVVAEFQVDPANRSVANAASRRVLLTIDQPQVNHNGGEITFGADGLLYLGFGDGGGQNDGFGGNANNTAGHAANGNGQSLQTLLAKLLRIDPLGRDVNGAYGIPAGNLAEMTGQQALPEIWAYGVRNPWRFSFDACTGDLYIGDVGQNQIEEVDFVAAAPETKTIAAGLNFGWRILEGNDCGPNAAECTDPARTGLILPVDTYSHQVGQSVTGGYVYRGSAIPGLRGHYIYADYQTKHVYRFRMNNGQLADKVEITNQIVAPGGGAVENIASFGQDNAGEVYVAAFEPGAVYRIVQAQ
ncbi:MAG TPA: PQQ-dependent sugar dehydrogenase [Polyangiaceae bacterium]|nr:PQQ-dependent sugar dehydrogenase [Polyangiaceae bacterium]